MKTAPPSVMQMLCGAGTPQPEFPEAAPEEAMPKHRVGDVSAYVEEIKKKLSSRVLPGTGCLIAAGDPHIQALEINMQRRRENEHPLSSQEAWDLVLRPDVFVWAPDKIFGEFVRCPNCNRPAAGSEWIRARTIHSLHAQKLYITMRYVCQHCPGASQVDPKTAGSKKRASKKTFLGDAPEVLANLPEHIQAMWCFVNTGRVMCDTSVTDLVRALATKNSWNGIADVINETKASHWVRSKIVPYLNLCKAVGLRPVAFDSDLPKENKLSADWVRAFFVNDAEKRAPEISAAMWMESGDDTLILDWTKDAAARCGKPYLLNAMDSGRRVLFSRLTETCKPFEARASLQELAQRGACPKVVYVDDECCGAWPNILDEIWPGVVVRLDILHAMMRLTQTVTSTQHPWHGRFCQDLSKAFYKQDPVEVARFRRAWLSDGRANVIPNRIRNKCVPRTVAASADIVANVEKTLQHYAFPHAEMGCLLTDATRAAWEKLRIHVERNCLSEPEHKETDEDEQTMRVGSEVFRLARSGRGSSSLEGFHAHQKQWLGAFAHHGADAGEALLAEGASRWNRKRRNEAATEENRIPNVFANGILQKADDLHMELTSARLYPFLARPCAN